MKALEPRGSRVAGGQNHHMDYRELLQEVHKVGEEGPLRVDPIVGRDPVARYKCIALQAHVVPVGIVPQALAVDGRGKAIHAV